MSLQLEQEAAAKFPTYNGDVRDFKAWAKRFVWRDQMKDRDLTSIQIEFAYQALGIEKPKAGG